MIYKFKKSSGGSFHRGEVNAQDVGEALAELAGNGKELRTEEVVNAARPNDSPLHDAFDWDDQFAGEQWRKHQARNLINAVVVCAEEGNKPIPAYVNVGAASDDRRYVETISASQNSDEWAQVIRSAKTAIETAFDRLETLERIANEQRQEALPFIGRSKKSLVDASTTLDSAQLSQGA